MTTGNTDIHNLELFKKMAENLKREGRYDLLLEAIGVPALQQMNIVAAEAQLSPLVITDDFRFTLPAYGKTVEMSPIHKALYILYLRHPEGIEFSYLQDHQKELTDIYRLISNRVSEEKINDTISRLTNPLDNAINEKCARIKQAFLSVMDVYQASYYIISLHKVRHIDGSHRQWFERKKVIRLPRELVKLPVSLA